MIWVTLKKRLWISRNFSEQINILRRNLMFVEDVVTNVLLVMPIRDHAPFAQGPMFTSLTTVMHVPISARDVLWELLGTEGQFFHVFPSRDKIKHGRAPTP